MWIAIAVLTLAATFAVVLAAVRRVRRRTFAVEVILTLAVLVCVETALMNALSVFQAVTRGGVVAAHLLVVAAAWAALGRVELASGVRRGWLALRRLGWGGVAVAPLGALIALSAWRYAPNNWDSMSYHMARVAHWIQLRSIANYDTNIVRQVSLLPGAEYLVLALQVVSGTDRLANFVQLVAWAAVVLVTPALARLAGAPRGLGIAAVPIVAAAPMLVLQASSTQNDLVAAVAATAGIVAAMPFLHRGGGRWRSADAGLLGLVLAAGAVVKLTAVVTVLPLLLVAAFQSARRVWSGAEPARRAAAGVGLLLVLASVVALPEVARRSGDARLSVYVSKFTYPVLGDFGDRALNVVRAPFRHLPAPRAVVAALGIPERCVQHGWLARDAIFSDHEEYAGNTLLALVALAAAGLAALRWRGLPRRGRLLLATTVAGWILFQVTFRDNEWISRLEVPNFALAAFLLAALAGLAPRPSRLAQAGAVAVALVAAAGGTRTALANDLRPPLGGLPHPVDAATSYYAEWPALRGVHDVVHTAARVRGCRRLGLALDEDSWDYPLTWRAMQAGIEVRHVLGRDPWPCLIFVQHPPAPPAELRWIPTNVPFLFLNAAEERAERSARP